MHELILAAAAANPVEWFGELLSGALGWILGIVQSVHPVLRTALAGLGILLETSVLVGLVVPGDTIVVVAATAVDSVPEYFALALTVIVGALCGESIGFLLGRFFGPRLRASRLGRRIGEAWWVRAENYLDRRGGIAIFVSRFLPFLHSLIPVTVGMSTMSYRRFIAWTLPACAIWAFAYVSVGTFAAGSFEALINQLHYAGYLFVGIVAVFAVGVVVAKKVIERNERRHMSAPGDGDVDTIDPA
jgi:membrane protein DedA with SNARE-associated domain